jgi:hypothetical protein
MLLCCLFYLVLSWCHAQIGLNITVLFILPGSLLVPCTDGVKCCFGAMHRYRVKCCCVVHFTRWCHAQIGLNVAVLFIFPGSLLVPCTDRVKCCGVVHLTWFLN